MFYVKRISVTFILLSLSALIVSCGRQPVTPTPTPPPLSETSIPVVLPAETSEIIPVQTEAAPSATIIFYNGTILTMESEVPIAEAIALSGERILAVGMDEDILDLQVPETRIIDLQGRTLMPGFIDPHTHIFNDAARFIGGDYYQQAQQLALQNGITTLGDMFVDAGFLAAMQDFDRAGQLHIRTSLYLLYNDACGQLTGDWYQQYPPSGEPGEMLHIEGVKVMADGGVCGGWARSYELPGVGYGDLWFTQEEMNQIVDKLDAAGYQVAIHAIGDRAVEQVLTALELTLDGRPNTLRHRIEHSATLRSDLIPRYSELGVVATIFGAYPNCDVEESPPPIERINDWEWPYRDLLLSNPDLHIAWHGDYPWMGPASPLWHLYSMVTPNSIFRDNGIICADPEWWTGRTFTVEEVLPMMTIEGAYALFRDEEVGSLEAGKFADLIVLSEDPTTVEPEAIKDLEVWMTMVGGDVEWCAPGHEAFCPFTSPPPPVSAPAVAFRDDFSGGYQPGWSWIREVNAPWSLTAKPGFLEMGLLSGSQPLNALVRTVDSENFQITTHLTFKPETNYQFAGLLIYQDDGTRVQLGRAYCDLPNSCAGNGIYFDAMGDGQVSGGNYATEIGLLDEAYLRINRTGLLFTGYYSEDGENWVLIGEHEVKMTDPLVGLYAGQSPEAGAVALFDYFTVESIP